MSEILVVVADAFAAAMYAVAIVVLVFVARGRRLDRTSMGLLAGLALMGLFLGISNALEHSGVTDALDLYEDYLEIAFTPLFLYFAYSVVTARELARRRAAEAELSRANRALKVIRHCLQVMARAVDEAELAQSICDVMVGVGGYGCACLEIAGATGDADAPLLARATQGSRRCDDEDREDREARGTGARLEQQLTPGPNPLGRVIICDGEHAGFDQAEARLLSELSEEIAYGLWSLRERRARRKAERALQESESRYRRLVELSPDAVLAVQDGRIAFVNRRGLSLLGADTADQVVGIAPGDLLAPEAGFEGAGEGLDDVLREGLPEGALGLGGEDRIVTVEARLGRLDGTSTQVELEGAPLALEGKPAALLIMRDITERKQVDALKEDFLSMVSHELRTPINAIMGYAALLGRTDAASHPNAHSRALERIPERASYMARLVDDLLEVIRIQSGELRLAKSPADLEQISRRCARDVVHDGRHSIKVQAEQGLPLVECDAARLTFAISNLLTNAVKFSPGGGRILVRVGGGPGVATISVSDEGVGIAKRDLLRIFDRFTQTDMSASRRFGGFGLGLHIVKRIVEAHGGTVSVVSEVGKGSTFTVSLPL